MRRLLLLMLLITGFSAGYAQEPNSKEAKKKAEEEKGRAIATNVISLIESKQFVIIPDSYTPPGKPSESVSDQASFFLYEGDYVYLQGAYVAPNTTAVLKMKPQDEEMKVDKKGNVTYEVNLIGATTSSKASISLYKGGDYADVIINDNKFGSKRFSGQLVPKSGAKYFRKANEL